MTHLPIRDVSLFVKRVGDGYPLLLLHGGPGLDHLTMGPFEPLAQEMRLIFIDQRCNGRSTGAPLDTFTFDNLTADLEGLRRYLGYDRWAVLGHSFGGMVALEYALRYPPALSHLLLVGTCGDIWWVQQNAPELLHQRGFSPRKVALARRFFNGEIEPGEMTKAMLNLGSAYYARLDLRRLWRDMLTGLRMQTRPETLIYGYSQLLKGWSVMDQLAEIQAPTLIIAGEEDFQFPPQHQTALAAGIPQAQLELIPQAGHNVPSEQPMLVNQLVRDFVLPVAVQRRQVQTVPQAAP